MITLRFEGESDDIFGEFNHFSMFGACDFSTDYANFDTGEPIRFAVEADGTTLCVIGQYCPHGSCCWAITVEVAAVANEDNEVGEESIWPDWPMRLEAADCGYSPRLIIEAPDDVSIRWLKKEGENDEAATRKE